MNQYRDFLRFWIDSIEKNLFNVGLIYSCVFGLLQLLSFELIIDSLNL